VILGRRHSPTREKVVGSAGRPPLVFERRSNDVVRSKAAHEIPPLLATPACAFLPRLSSVGYARPEPGGARCREFEPRDPVSPSPPVRVRSAVSKPVCSATSCTELPVRRNSVAFAERSWVLAGREIRLARSLSVAVPDPDGGAELRHQVACLNKSIRDESRALSSLSTEWRSFGVGKARGPSGRLRRARSACSRRQRARRVLKP
jgi:hypothetical protein